MSSLWQMPAVIVFLAAWLASPPAGLVDVSQREAFRRLATQKSQATLTNLGVPQEPVPPAAVSMGTPPAADSAAKPAETAASGAKPDPKRDEGWWRQKMAELRAAAEKDQVAADTLQTRINRLQADSVNIDDPLKQTRARMELVTAIDQLDKMKVQVEADRRAIAALQEEARRLSVPAGWIR